MFHPFSQKNNLVLKLIVSLMLLGFVISLFRFEYPTQKRRYRHAVSLTMQAVRGLFPSSTRIANSTLFVALFVTLAVSNLLSNIPGVRAPTIFYYLVALAALSF